MGDHINADVPSEERTLVLQWRNVNRATRAMILERIALGVAAGVFDARPKGPDPDSILVLLLQPTGALLGFATFYEVTGKRLWLDLLWVEERHRRHGHATRLLGLVEGLAKDKHLEAIVLGRMNDNQAMALAKAGWTIDHVVHRRRVTA